MDVVLACGLGDNPFHREPPIQQDLSAVGPPKLTIRHCNVKIESYERGISVRQGTSLEIQHCTISGQRYGVAIEVSPWANTVVIEDNTIKNFDSGISIQRFSDPMSDPCAQIKIINNVFEDVYYAVYEQTDERHTQQLKIKGTDRYELRGNRRRGRDIDKLNDPNMIHHIKGDHCEYPSDSDFA